ncbi:MAG: SDR family oxidoreductase [Moraxellaceae bacterium]|nr:SDR family oxidoreductase [Moraxellaceae bacterium]
MSEPKLNGKVALVAGGAKNLGGQLSRQLAALGARVAVHYNSDSSRADADATVAAIKAGGGDAFALQADLTRVAEVERVFAETVKHFGGLDIAINTAGLVLKKPITEVTEDDYDRSFDINSKAAFFFLREAGKHVRDGGRICTIVTSLLGAFTGYYAAYAGSKAPVEHFTRAASKEFGARGISVTAVGPGPMDTPFFYGQESAEAVAYHSNAADLSRYSSTGLTDVKDIVPIVIFLVTDGWWITGQTILANGGYTTK